MKSPITTHVLDTALGRPAQGLPIMLEFQEADWHLIGRGATNADGRIMELLAPDTLLRTGFYRLTFDTATYFGNIGVQGFYPYVQIIFEIRDVDSHYHVPLLLSPWGYSTYRGS